MTEDNHDEKNKAEDNSPENKETDERDLKEEIERFESGEQDSPTQDELRDLRDEIKNFEPREQEETEQDEIELEDPIGVTQEELEQSIPELGRTSYGELSKKAATEYDTGMYSTTDSIFDIIPEMEGGFIVYESFDRSIGANKTKKMFELADNVGTSLDVIRGEDTDSFIVESEKYNARSIADGDYVVPGNYISLSRNGLNAGLFNKRMYESFSEYIDQFADIMEEAEILESSDNNVEDVIDQMDDQAVGLVKMLYEHPGDPLQNEFMEYLGQSDHAHNQTGKLEAVAGFYDQKGEALAESIHQNPKDAVLDLGFSESYARMRERNSLPGGLYVVSGVEDLLSDQKTSKSDVTAYLKQNEKLWFTGYHPTVLIEDDGPLSRL